MATSGVPGVDREPRTPAMNICLAPIDVPMQPVSNPAHVKSVYTDCVDEANRYKWIESEKAGYDLGETAIKRWVKEHWSGYLRAKWLEHLQGRCFWIELDQGDFGLLQREFKFDKDLLDRILDRLKAGQENLDIINWAVSFHLPIETCLQILEALDINSRRLAHRFEVA